MTTDTMISPDTALVTGGGGLLGRAICAELAATGYRRIAVLDLDATMAEATARAIRAAGAEAITIVGDVTDPDLPARAVEAVTAGGRRLSCIVNNAAANRPGSAKTVRREDWDLMMRVNLAAPMFLCQAAIPHWEAQGAGACVVNISSRAWLAGVGVAYSSCKAGLVGLTNALSVELGPLGVRVNAVGPSWFDSPFNHQSRTPESLQRIADVQSRISSLGRTVTPEEVAGVVGFLASAKAAFVTGETIYVAGGGQLAVNAASTRAF